MKSRILAIALCICGGSAQAGTVDFTFSGELGANNLSINRPFANGTFTGMFSIDTDIIDSVTSSRVLYRLTEFNAVVNGPDGDSRSFNGPNRNDGPLLDETASFFAVFRQDTLSINQGFELGLFEIYDGSEVASTRAADRRFLRLQFDAQSSIGLIDSFESLALSDQQFGATSRFEGGEFQLGLSTVPTRITSAQVTALIDDVPAVPLPAAGYGLLAGIAGLLMLGGRRRPKKSLRS